MNLRHRAADVPPGTRAVKVSDLAQVPPSESDGVRAEIAKVAASWEVVRGALTLKEHRKYEVTNARTGQKLTKWGVFVQSKTSGKFCRVGWPQKSEEKAKCVCAVDGVGCTETDSLVFGRDGPSSLEYLPPDTMSVSQLVQCLKTVVGLNLSSDAQRWLADTGDEPSPPPLRAWLGSILKDDDMVDSFVEFWPLAEERFTNWLGRSRPHASGSRVDYIFVDRIFFQRHARQGASLDTG